MDLQKIKDYVLGDSKEPLVVHGESGCGKTSIMALAAREAFSWIHGNGMVIMRWSKQMKIKEKSILVDIFGLRLYKSHCKKEF